MKDDPHRLALHGPQWAAGLVFPHRVEVECLADGEAEAMPVWLKGVPGKRAVYLLSDGEGRAVQLLCVGNLRASLKRRLLMRPAAAASRRVDYRGVVRFIDFRLVDSDFESDLVYLEAARRLFPLRYGELLGFRPSVWVHVDVESRFPRFVRTTDLSRRPGVLVGPVEDLTSATELVQRLESAFDLCRHHHILVEAPNGKACPYKDMGRCPAPCDGSLSLEQYRRMVGLGLQVLLEAGDAVREQQERMRQAAAELRFELAGRIKQYVEELSAFGKGPFRHVRRLEDFQYVVLQPGPTGLGGRRWVKVMLVTPGVVSEEFSVSGEAVCAGELLRHLFEEAERRRGQEVDAAGAERMAVVAGHLFRPRRGPGVFLPLSELDERGLKAGLREACRWGEHTSGEGKVRQRHVGLAAGVWPGGDDDDEGITRELGSE